jgi:hypothetical protein
LIACHSFHRYPGAKERGIVVPMAGKYKQAFSWAGHPPNAAIRGCNLVYFIARSGGAGHI